ncbi:hypothetical protein NW755_009258 [Fusarium falciforme]|uniref:Uncharacterized protein n=1 Tax=Fusarium falciforme TaxID=195108 RepID=A0A9W8R1K7_9HYPO|nr:hypothetical protein NW755_009258 [Fusarium falciforme]
MTEKPWVWRDEASHFPCSFTEDYQSYQHEVENDIPFPQLSSLGIAMFLIDLSSCETRPNSITHHPSFEPRNRGNNHLLPLPLEHVIRKEADATIILCDRPTHSPAPSSRRSLITPPISTAET